LWLNASTLPCLSHVECKILKLKFRSMFIHQALDSITSITIANHSKALRSLL
jgi:hypothetical protein